MNETVRRVTLWVIALGGWAWSIGAATWAVLEFDPNHGNFAPQWVSLSIFLAMGFAIASGVAIGRINSVRTLASIFQAGMETAERAQQIRHDQENEDDAA